MTFRTFNSIVVRSLAILSLLIGGGLLAACDGGGEGLADGTCKAVQIQACRSPFDSVCPSCPDNDAFCVAIDGNAANDRCCGCGVPFAE